jgi:hypothetical protein
VSPLGDQRPSQAPALTSVDPTAQTPLIPTPNHPTHSRLAMVAVTGMLVQEALTVSSKVRSFALPSVVDAWLYLLPITLRPFRHCHSFTCPLVCAIYTINTKPQGQGPIEQLGLF